MLIRTLKTGGRCCWNSGFPVIGTRGRPCGGSRTVAQFSGATAVRRKGKRKSDGRPIQRGADGPMVGGMKGGKKGDKYLSNAGIIVVLRPQIESSYNIGLGVFAGWRGR